MRTWSFLLLADSAPRNQTEQLYFDLWLKK